MASKKLKVLALIDLPSPPPEDQNFSQHLKHEDWKDEKNVVETIKSLGHEVRIFGIFDDIQPLVEELKSDKPDVVFNMCETFNNDRDQEPNIAAVLELLGIPHTGANARALRLCKDKGLTKKILSFHRVRVPRFEISHKIRPRKKIHKRFVFPGLCKPLGLEASEGIAKTSLVKNEKDCLERLQYIHEKYGVDAIVEEFISGREFYVGVLGNDRLTVFPPQELFFKSVPDGDPRIATYKAKWDQEYRRKWGIDSGKAKAIEPLIKSKLDNVCKKIYRIFGLCGYARVDLRLSEQGEVVFIEVNPNPAIAKTDDFASGAKEL